MVHGLAFDELYDVDARSDPYLDEYVKARDRIAAEGPWAVKEMEALAYRGSIMAILYVSDAMRAGTTYDQDLPGAERWYEVAVASGSIRGLTGLAATHLLMGKVEQAVTELDAAIQKNYPPAMNDLAGIYFRGDLGRRDKPTALALYQRGASLGHFPSKVNLVRLSLHGRFGFWRRWRVLHEIPGVVADHLKIQSTNPYTDRVR